MVTKTVELCPSFLSQAREISVKFKQVFKLFAACHLVYESADYLNSNIGKIPRHDDHTKAPYARRTCLTFSSTMDSMVNKGLKEYTPSTPSPSILTM